MARPSLLCVMGMLLALVIPIGALSLVAEVASGWVAGAPLSRLSQAAEQLEAPELGADLTETTSGVMRAWPKYFLAFGAASCLIAAAVGSALCAGRHPGWFSLVFVPLLAVPPGPSVGWTLAWALGWAVAGFAGAVLVYWLRIRAQIPVS